MTITCFADAAPIARPAGRHMAAAQRLRSLVPLAYALAPHLLRMTPDEFRMLVAGAQATALSIRQAVDRRIRPRLDRQMSAV